MHDETAQYNKKGMHKDLKIMKEIQTIFEDTSFKFRVPIKTSCGVSDKNWAIASGDDGELDFTR